MQSNNSFSSLVSTPLKFDQDGVPSNLDVIQDSDCMICTDKLHNDLCCVVPCNHVYHHQCLNKQLTITQDRRCVQCRKSIEALRLCSIATNSFGELIKIGQIERHHNAVVINTAPDTARDSNVESEQCISTPIVVGSTIGGGGVMLISSYIIKISLLQYTGAALMAMGSVIAITKFCNR